MNRQFLIGGLIPTFVIVERANNSWMCETSFLVEEESVIVVQNYMFNIAMMGM